MKKRDNVIFTSGFILKTETLDTINLLILFMKKSSVVYAVKSLGLCF